MRFGLPYMGSKNTIAKKIIDTLPAGDTFIDVFAGGCAVTHAALLSGKYKHIICNDITDSPQLFYDAIHGKYKNETRWISREDFFKQKDTDPYIRTCWSFGNNQKAYLYNQNLEPYKKALHYARVFNDFSLFKEMNIDLSNLFSEQDASRLNLKRLADYIRRQYNAYIGLDRLQSLGRLDRLQSLQNLERLQSLERLGRLQSLEISQCDYKQLTIPKDAIVYCDPPYENTAGYLQEFNGQEFYEWAKGKGYYISSYNAPFKIIASWDKTCTLSATNNSRVVKENLYLS